MKTIPKKILIINTFGIGDVLFTTPLVSNIKHIFPDCSIGFVCNARTYALLEKNPDVDKLFIYERDEFFAVYKKSRLQYWKKVQGLLNDIKREKYDLAFDLSLNGSMNFFTWRTGIKERVGLNYRNRSRFLTRKIDFDGFEGKHVVDYYLSLLNLIGHAPRPYEMTLPISTDDERWVDEIWRDKHIKPQDNVIGIVPGGGASWGKEAFYRQWPVENYAKLADKLIENFSAKIILLGDKNEIELCSKVQDFMKHPCLSLLGQATLSQYAALLKKCNLVVMNDGGPLHIATAAGANVVSLFGPVDEAVYGPYTSKRQTIVKKGLSCQPCYRRFRMSDCRHLSCLRTLTVDEVFLKASKAWSEKAIL